MNNDYNKIDYSCFPAELKLYPVWAPVKTRLIDGFKSFHPVDVRHGGSADAKNPATWTTHVKALHYANSRRVNFEFLALALPKELGCFSLSFREVKGVNDIASRHALSVTEKFNTYTEESNTGRGITVIGFGHLGADVMLNDLCRLEAKGKNKFIIVTGKPVIANSIRNCQTELDAMKKFGILQYSYKALLKIGKVTPPPKFSSGYTYGPTGS